MLSLVSPHGQHTRNTVSMVMLAAVATPLGMLESACSVFAGAHIAQSHIKNSTRFTMKGLSDLRQNNRLFKDGSWRNSVRCRYDFTKEKMCF